MYLFVCIIVEYTTGFPCILENLENPIKFPGPGNVLEFYKIWQCPRKNIACEKYPLRTNKKIP